MRRDGVICCSLAMSERGTRVAVMVPQRTLATRVLLDTLWLRHTPIPTLTFPRAETRSMTMFGKVGPPAPLHGLFETSHRVWSCVV